MPNLDNTDRRILDALQGNGRLTNLELAQRVGLSPSPCLRRVRALEESGAIGGYAARVNPRAVGLNVMAFVLVRLERHGEVDTRKFRQALKALPEVVACYITSGEFDLLLHVVVADLDEYRKFSLDRLLRVPFIRDIRTSFVIDTVVDSRPLPVTP
jgi:Lrp/AsnC family leucine-responsive transcriptional regulator